jgi:hypothetical protein
VSDAPIPFPEEDLLPPLPDKLTQWKSLELPDAPVELTDPIAKLAEIGKNTVAILTAIRAVLNLLAQTSIELDPVKLLLSASILAIEEGLNTLLEDAGLYALFVPVQRKVIVAPRIQEALALTGLSAGIPPRVRDVATLLVQARLASQNRDVVAFLNNGATGGNVGFYRTVVEATYDDADPNRPTFGVNDYVAGVYVVAGAPDYLQLLSLVAALDGLFVPPMSDGLSKPGLPVPQDLRVQPVQSLQGTPGAYLQWRPQVAFIRVPTLDVSCLITHVAIIRSRSPKSLNAVSPEALFGTNQLTVGLASPSDPDTVVLDVLDYADIKRPMPNTYSDFSGELENGGVYYYHACYRIKVGSFSDVASGATFPDRGFYKLSGVGVVTATNRAVRSGRGARPDWVRTPSVVSLMPLLGELTTLLLGTLKNYKASATGIGDNFRTYVKFLQDQIDRFATALLSLSGLVSKFTSITTQSIDVGAYARAFAGKGGVDFMLADLGTSLLPGNTDPQRPPFDRGDEFVTGTVVLVGGPSEERVRVVATMINTLFGVSGSGMGPSPLQAALTAIDAVLAQEEEAVFGVDFTTPGTVTSAVTASDNPPLVNDGTDPGNCGPDPVPPPVFGDDFGVTS